MKLLIKRDPNHLIATEAKVEVDSDAPRVLKIPRYILPSDHKTLMQRSGFEDLIIANEKDAEETETNLRTAGVISAEKQTEENGDFTFLPLNKPIQYLRGLWSGHRSVLVQDANTGDLYRLKGVGLNPEKPEIIKFDDKTWEVFGGQPTYSAEFEKQMSDKWNRILANEGIEPAMTCKGYWHYPIKAKRKDLSASLIKVAGDTRLDEFMAIVENYCFYRLEKQTNAKINRLGEKLSKNIADLYYSIEMSVGVLKCLMDLNNQTWSSDCQRSNAHLGNVVLYNGTDQVKIGFVDFDSSCDINDFPESKLREIQKNEYNTIINSACQPPISMRQINAKFMNWQTLATYNALRTDFQQGFIKGYQDMKNASASHMPRTIRNTIPFERFLEIFDVLRSGAGLIQEPIIFVPGVYSIPYTDDKEKDKNSLEKMLEDSICDKKKYEKEHDSIYDPYGILGKNKQYQNLIHKSPYKSLNYI